MSAPAGAATSPLTELLVMGLGNVLLGDDGVGVRAIEALEREYETPPGVEILDGGTLGLALLGDIAGARRVILVDAVASGEEPGTLVHLDGDAVEPAVRHRLSPHQVGVADLLDALRLIDCLPESLELLGVVPASLGLGTELSPPVRGCLPALVAAIVREAAELGHPLAAKAPCATAAR